MTKIEDALEGLGLDEKEAKVYLTLIQLGQDTAFNIAKRALIKRPTCYLVLESLKAKGLVAVSKTRKATLFSAVEPHKLHQIIRERETRLAKILPELDALFNLRPQKPRVEFFEGPEGMKTVYFEITRELGRGVEVLFFGTFQHVETYLKDQIELWKTTLLKNKHARARELINDTALERAYAKEMGGLGGRYPIRFIPKKLGQTHADFAVYGNKVALISARKELSATVIEDPQIADAFRLMYELAWLGAKR